MARLKRRKPKWLLGFCCIVGVGSLSLLVSLNTNANPPAQTDAESAQTLLPKKLFRHHHSLWKAPSVKMERSRPADGPHRSS